MKHPSRQFAILAFAIIFSVATTFVFSGAPLLDLQAAAKPFAVFSHAIRNALPTINPNPVAAATLPGATQNLSAAAGNGQNSLSWNAPVSNGGATITSYRVFRGTNSANTQLVTSGGCANLGAVFACTDTGLTNGQSYDYVVSTVNSVGQGTPSNSATTTTATAAQFSQQGPKLVRTGTVGNAFQGGSVSLSADGNTAIGGANTQMRLTARAETGAVTSYFKGPQAQWRTGWFTSKCGAVVGARMPLLSE